jgi:Dirigent-like protein
MANRQQKRDSVGWRVPLTLAVLIGAALVVNAGCGGGGGGESLSVVAPAKGLHQATVDVGPKGTSGGDVYVFDGPLLDSDEEERVGNVYGTQTSIAQDSDSETVQAMITYDLEGGDRITVGGIGEYPRGDKSLVENQKFERPILGGTGRYAGARGVVTTVRRPDGSYAHTFEIED